MERRLLLEQRLAAAEARARAFAAEAALDEEGGCPVPLSQPEQHSPQGTGHVSTAEINAADDFLTKLRSHVPVQNFSSPLVEVVKPPPWQRQKTKTQTQRQQQEHPQDQISRETDGKKPQKVYNLGVTSSPDKIFPRHQVQPMSRGSSRGGSAGSSRSAAALGGRTSRGCTPPTGNDDDAAVFNEDSLVAKARRWSAYTVRPGSNGSCRSTSGSTHSDASDADATAWRWSGRPRHRDALGRAVLQQAESEAAFLQTKKVGVKLLLSENVRALNERLFLFVCVPWNFRSLTRLEKTLQHLGVTLR
jgi:hypothetical protein